MAIALAFLSLAVGGCGGDDDDQGGQAPSATETSRSGDDATVGESESGAPDDGTAEEDQPSHAEYIRAADQICVDAREELGSTGRDLEQLLRQLQSGEIDKREYYQRSGDLTADFAATGRSAIEEIEALPQPRTRQSALEAYLDATREQVALLEKQAEALRDVRLRASAKLNSQLIQARTATQKAARRFGFHVCGGG